MPRSFFAATSALLGGGLWILLAVLGLGDDPLARTLDWVGLALILVAAAAAATDLVSSDVLPLRVLVTVAAPLLAWSVIEFFRPDDGAWYAAAWGTAAVVAGTRRLWAERETLLPAPRPPAGSHARGSHVRSARGAHAR